jgi:outer membrane autotransporter protein
MRASTGVTTLTLNNSGTLVNSDATGVVVSATAAPAVSVTVNNAGTISGSANMGSIVTGAGNDTVNNTGTIRGSINLGAGTNTVTINGGTVTGSATIITTGAGDDTFNMLNNGSVTGLVDLGAGNNIANINASTLNGGLTLGIGNDTVNILNDATTGAIILGDGTNTMNVSNSTMTSGTLGGAGVDTLTLLNSTVSGTIDLAAGADVLNISGTETFTTRGDINNVETVNISATRVELNNGLTGVTTLRLNNGSTLNVSNSFATAAAGSIQSSGTLFIGAGRTVSAATVNMVGGNLTIGVTSATSAGRLFVGSAATGMTATSITIAMAPNANFIASGTALTIVDGSATATLAANTLTSTQQGVHTFALALGGANQDIVLTIGRVSTSSLLSGGAGAGVANLLDGLGNTATGALASVQSAITQATTAAEVNRVVESLQPGLDGLGAANLGITTATGGQISNRLASLRTGVATGDAMANRNMWAEGFGSSASQDEKSGRKGYDANGGGVTFGLDTDELVDGANVGAAFTYGKGNVKSDSGNLAETDINSYIGTVYGSRILNNGVFVNAQAGLGMNKYDMKRTVANVGQASGETDGWQASLKGEVGRDYAHGKFTLTPSFGVQYTYLDVDGYTETGAGSANLIVNTDAMSTFDLTAGGKAAYTIALANGNTLRPNVRAGVTTRAGDTNLDATSRFTSVATNFSTPGVKTDRTGFNLGAGLLLGSANGMDVSADYDADIRDGYTGHAGKLKVRYAF